MVLVLKLMIRQNIHKERSIIFPIRRVRFLRMREHKRMVLVRGRFIIF